MPKTRLQKESDYSIFKHLMVLVERLGFEGAEKKLSELSKSAIKDDIDAVRNSVIAEVCKVFGLKKDVFSKGAHSAMDTARHQGLTTLVAVLHGELDHNMKDLALFLNYEKSSLYFKWNTFNELKRDSKVATERELLEKYDKVVAALKAKKIIS